MKDRSKLPSGKDIARMVDNRFEILEALYPDKEYTMTELSEKTGIDLGNLSKQINGAKKIVGLLAIELPSGETLIDVREEERERGRPLKYIKLTEAGRKIISPMIEAPSRKETADLEEINFYLDVMKEPSNDENLKLASEEFMRLCGEYIVAPNEDVLSFLEQKLTNPGYKTIHLNLLYSLQQIVKKTSDENALSEIKLKFEELLKKLASNITLEQSNDGPTLRLHAIETLLDILGCEDGFKELTNLYEEGIRNNSKLIDNMRTIILSKYSEKRIDVKKILFKLLSDPNEEVRIRATNEIRNLRSSH